MGNHELMAVKCMDLLCEEITTETIKRLDHSFVENLLIWQENGGYSTIDELRCCDAQTKNDLIEYISDTANPALLPEEEWYDVDVITCAAPNLQENPSNGYNQGDGSARVIKLHEKLHEKTKCS